MRSLWWPARSKVVLTRHEAEWLDAVIGRIMVSMIDLVWFIEYRIDFFLVVMCVHGHVHVFWVVSRVTVNYIIFNFPLIWDSQNLPAFTWISICMPPCFINTTWTDLPDGSHPETWFAPCEPSFNWVVSQSKSSEEQFQIRMRIFAVVRIRMFAKVRTSLSHRLVFFDWLESEKEST